MRADHQKLIDELYHNAEVSQKPLEQRLADLSVWFFSNKDRIPANALEKKCDFLEKTCWVLIELAALQAERLHELEQSGASRHLWLPSGMRFEKTGENFR